MIDLTLFHDALDAMALEEQAQTFVRQLFERFQNRKCDVRLLAEIRAELVARFGDQINRIFVLAPTADDPRMARIGLFNGDITASEFEWRFGFAPQQDDLHRVNCERAGQAGHYACGICQHYDRPRFLCERCLPG